MAHTLIVRPRIPGNRSDAGALLFIAASIFFALLYSSNLTQRTTTYLRPAEGPGATGSFSFAYVSLLNRKHWLIADKYTVWRTEDGGLTWTRSYQISGNEFIGGLSFIDEIHGFLVAGPHLLQTSDGGTTWVGQHDLNFVPLSICFINLEAGWAAGFEWTQPGVSQGAIWATKDGGQSWQKQKVDISATTFPEKGDWNLTDIFFIDKQYGWAVGRWLIFWTDNGGATWHVADAENAPYTRVHFLNQNFGWAMLLDEERIPVTSDGGHHWEMLAGPPRYGGIPSQAVFLTPNHSYAALLKLYESTDGGKTWGWRLGDYSLAGAVDYLGQARDGTLIALKIEGHGLKALTSEDNGVTWR